MKLIKLFVASALAAAACGAHADTNTLTITGTIAGVCKFNSSTSAISVTMDPSSSADATGATTIPYKCTKGTSPTFTAGNGLNYASSSRNLKQTASPSATIPYTLALGAASVGTGMGNTLNLSATVTVANADFINADATVTTYTDQVVLTVTP